MSSRQESCPDGPPFNTDIAGIGVRTSFYAQSCIYAILAVRSNEAGEIATALSTLLATDVAMIISAFILGMKANPSITFHDGIIVFYLTVIASASLLISLTSYARFRKRSRTIHVMIVVQTLLVIAFGGALLAQANTFGSMPECNRTIVVVLLFFPIRKLHIALPLLITLTILFGGTFVCLLICDYRNTIGKLFPRPSIFRSSRQMYKTNTRGSDCDRLFDNLTIEERRDDMVMSPQRGTIISTNNTGRVSSAPKKSVQWHPAPPETRKRIDAHKTPNNGGYWGLLIAKLMLIVIIGTLLIANLELLIRKNRFQGSDLESEWGFGQTLPLMLIALPLLDVVRMYYSFRLHPRPHSSRKRFSYL